MKNYIRRLLALLIALVMVLGLLPTAAFAETPSGSNSPDNLRIFTEDDKAILDEDVFAGIESVKSRAAQKNGVSIGMMTEADYAALVPQVIEAIESSETYVPGTLQQNGSFLVWETTVGLPCCYSPHMEAELNNTQNVPTPEQAAQAEAEAELLLDLPLEPLGGGGGSPDIGLIQPYWESSSSYADSSFNNYSPAYKSMWQSLYTTTGGAGIRYSMSNANVNNIASALTRCGLVIWDSHGNTDYESGYDYTSRANTSYLCLITSAGITSADTAQQTGDYGTYYHALTGSGYAFVDGTCISNHMNGVAPHSLLYMGICLGMATAGLQSPLRAKGVEVVYGYSQSVSFVGEKAYMQAILGEVKNGDTFSSAVRKAKDSVGPWDYYSSYPTIEQAIANYAAFPITVSSEDRYPGHGRVDALQTVRSTWVLQGDTFEVNAVPNNADWGSVSVLGYTVTAVPNEGYYTDDAIVTEGDATVSRLDDNTFYIEPTTDCSVQVNFAAKTAATVTYVSSGTVVGTASTFVGDDVILPAEVTEVPEWTFVGWTTDHVSVTSEKPVYFRPGTSYTVTAENVTLFAVYKHVEGNGGLCYQLVTETPDDWEGRYVISSAANTGMTVMKGVAGDEKIESTGSCNAAFSGTGITLEDSVLRDVDELYVFEAKKRSGSAYSFQNVSKGTYLSIDNMYLWVHTNYSSSYADWNLHATSGGVTMKSTSGDSYPYLYFSSGSFAAGNSSSSVIRLWKEIDDGTTSYWTDPVVEAHEHQMTAYPAVAPTCASAGNIAYWRCTVCYKYFSDAAGENEITLASTVIPATGEHTFGEWISNNSGSHKHVCTVCGFSETKSCAYQDTVTPPTPLEQGFTTHTCTFCGYSFNDSFIPALGMDYTVTFSVPDECEQPAEMISNTNTGITLPTVEAPEGCKFLGWVEAVLDNVDVKPEVILTGHYVASSDVTLYALFKYFVEDSGGVSGFRLVTEAPDDWAGNYVVTYGDDTDLWFLTGVKSGSYESASSGGSTGYAASGAVLRDELLTQVDDRFVFEMTAGNTGWSLRSLDKGTYLQESGGMLKAATSYRSNTCDWSLIPGTDNSVAIKNVNAASYPYVSYNESKNYFMVKNSASTNVHLWRESLAGTTWWTTVIADRDLVDVYFVDRDGNETAFIYASGDNAENAAFPGVSAAARGVDENGDNWYKITLDRNVYDSVTFSDGAAEGATAALSLGENTAIVYSVKNRTGACEADLWPAPPVVVEPTCTEQGSVTYFGLLTGEPHATQTSALGHAFGEWIETTAPDCVTAGEETRYCSRCGATETQPVEAPGHDYAAVVTEPTCTTQGYTTHTCSRCGDSFTDTTVDALGHDLIHHDAQAPNCTEIGWKAYDTCSRCDYSTYEELPALDHDLIHHAAQAPTCTRIGWEAYDSCSRCDYTTYSELPALGHDLTGHAAQTPTCTQIGWEAYDTCSRCDYTTYVELPALGHDLIHHASQAPTCTGIGWEAYDTCSRCNYTTYVELPALDHDLIHHAAQAPTCTQIGWGAYDACSRCNYTTYVELPALGHDLTSHTAQAPTCTKIGWEDYDTCSRCDYTTYSELPALGHDYQAAVTAPTCTEGGYTTHTCTRCGDCYTDSETAALGHSFGSWKENRPTMANPIATYVGHYRNCERCGIQEIGSHTWNEGSVTTPPTCTAEGVKTFTCTACSAVKTEVIEAAGHQPKAAAREKETAVSCTAPGGYDTVIRCAVCSNILSTEHTQIPALGHDYQAAVTAPTCTESGYTTYTCSRCNDTYTGDETAALGHAWAEPSYTWSEDDAQVTAIRVCGNDPAHVETEAVQTVSEVSLEPTLDADGEMTYTAVFQNSAFAVQTKTTVLPKLGPTLPCDGGETCPGKAFTDMPAKGNWAHDAIDWAIVHNITSGTSQTTFGPGKVCTRAQVVTFLWRAAGSPEPQAANNPFADVTPTSFCYKAVLWATENGITAGTGTSSFGPNAACTREQVATFLWRFAGSPEPETTNCPFMDVKPDSFSYKAILWAAENGITTGTSDTTFSQKQTCTRAQIVTFLWRYMSK